MFLYLINSHCFFSCTRRKNRNSGDFRVTRVYSLFILPLYFCRKSFFFFLSIEIKVTKYFCSQECQILIDKKQKSFFIREGESIERRKRENESEKLSQERKKITFRILFFFAQQLKCVFSFSILRSVVKSEQAKVFERKQEKKEKRSQLFKFFFSICLSGKLFDFPLSFLGAREIKSNKFLLK